MIKMDFEKRLKAQFWSFDVIFAMLIFGVALTVLAYTWYNINNQLSLSYGNGGIIMQMQAQALAQNLVSQGTPASWTGSVNTTNTLTWSNVSVGIGSSQTGTNLSIKKIYTLLSMTQTNYQATKQLLGIGYDYYIIISGGGINITIGENPITNSALTIYVEKRSAFLQSTPVTVTVELWTNTPLGIS